MQSEPLSCDTGEIVESNTASSAAKEQCSIGETSAENASAATLSLDCGRLATNNVAIASLQHSDPSSLSVEGEKQLGLEQTVTQSVENGTESADVNSMSIMLDNGGVDICRICHSEGDSAHPLIQPCLCAGSLRYVHHPCLQKWILESSTKSCELCRFQFIMSSESKPFSKWKKLDLTSVERRRVICSVSFHIVALVCVIWSLWVLLERTAEEVSKHNYGWAFWTKLVVVTVGFTGGVVFMYVQCKMYIRLCRRWRTYNRVIYIQDRSPPYLRLREGSSTSENQQQINCVVYESGNQTQPPICKVPCSANTGSPPNGSNLSSTVYTVL